MTYYIFLKSLRSLDEFRKNPHVKIPPKSPSTNFQRLGKFKNSIFNSEILFPYFRPGRPCSPLGLWPSQPLASLPPQAETILAGPPSPFLGCVFPEVRFPLWFVSSELAASHSSLCPADCCRFLPSLLAARPLTSRCPMRYSLHALIPLLNLPP
jgi:hypothetical protein